MSNTTTRVLVAFIAIPGILILAVLGGYYWYALVLVLGLIGSHEFIALARRKGAYPQAWILYPGIVLFITVFIFPRLYQDLLPVIGKAGIPLPSQFQLFTVLSIVFMVAIFSGELFRKGGSILANTGATMTGLWYIGLFLGTCVGIRELYAVPDFPVGQHFSTMDLNPEQMSRLWLWGGYTLSAVLATIWICDTAAFFGGKAMGKRKLYPSVSPKKTWAGAVWGFASAVAAMILFKYAALDYLDVVHAGVIGLVIGTVGQIGDLVESKFKRDADIKDSSSLIPGHGGILDRFDSLLFISPVVYLYLDYVVFAR
ncbi:MAG: phosphatidate cytidylyltransferase [Chlorobi bacterium]|nr:phosphatidate cytidylyltransferase [Chlorobiota bacterium]